MANPNMVNVTSILGKTSVLVVPTTATTIVENLAASNKIFKINSLIISNITGSSVNISSDVFRSSVAYSLASVVAVPSGSTLVLISKDTGIYLEEGDSIRLLSSAATSLHAVCSYEEIS